MFQKLQRAYRQTDKERKRQTDRHGEVNTFTLTTLPYAKCQYKKKKTEKNERQNTGNVRGVIDK